MFNGNTELHIKYLGMKLVATEAAIQSGSYKKLFWKYAANFQENTHAEVWFQ